MKRYAIVLAAGKGTRMKSEDPNMPKVAFPVLGQPLVRYVIDALKPLNIEKIVAVVGHGGQIASQIVKPDCETVWQLEQKGSGHAVMQATPVLSELDGATIVCCGDTPLLTAETLADMFEKHIKEGNDLTIMTSVLENPTGYGRIYKEGDQITRIIEQKDATPEQQRIKEINAGVYIFNNKELFKALGKITTNNAAGEYYLTDVIEIFAKAGLKVRSYPVKDVEETLGVNDREQLANAERILQRRINSFHQKNGVIIEAPETTKIGPKVKIGRGSIIGAGVSLFGEQEIPENTVIRTNTSFSK